MKTLTRIEEMEEAIERWLSKHEARGSMDKWKTLCTQRRQLINLAENGTNNQIQTKLKRKEVR
jgi:hypothetical protein